MKKWGKKSTEFQFKGSSEGNPFHFWNQSRREADPTWPDSKIEWRHLQTILSRSRYESWWNLNHIAENRTLKFWVRPPLWTTLKTQSNPSILRGPKTGRPDRGPKPIIPSLGFLGPTARNKKVSESETRADGSSNLRDRGSLIDRTRYFQRFLHPIKDFASSNRVNKLFLRLR